IVQPVGPGGGRGALRPILRSSSARISERPMRRSWTAMTTEAGQLTGTIFPAASACVDMACVAVLASFTRRVMGLDLIKKAPLIGRLYGLFRGNCHWGYAGGAITNWTIALRVYWSA